jgi:hypothetical protein
VVLADERLNSVSPRGKVAQFEDSIAVAEFLESLTEAAKEIGEVSDEEILQTVRAYRKERRAPEITVAAES